MKPLSLLPVLLFLAACSTAEKDSRRYTSSNTFPIGS